MPAPNLRSHNVPWAFQQRSHLCFHNDQPSSSCQSEERHGALLELIAVESRHLQLCFSVCSSSSWRLDQVHKQARLVHAPHHKVGGERLVARRFLALCDVLCASL